MAAMALFGILDRVGRARNRAPPHRFDRQAEQHKAERIGEKLARSSEMPNRRELIDSDPAERKPADDQHDAPMPELCGICASSG